MPAQRRTESICRTFNTRLAAIYILNANLHLMIWMNCDGFLTHCEPNFRIQNNTQNFRPKMANTTINFIRCTQDLFWFLQALTQYAQDRKMNLTGTVNISRAGIKNDGHFSFNEPSLFRDCSILIGFLIQYRLRAESWHTYRHINPCTDQLRGCFEKRKLF